MGLDEDLVDEHSSNALSEMAYSLMDENFHYSEGPNHHIPTYHVVHSDQEEEKNSEKIMPTPKFKEDSKRPK